MKQIKKILSLLAAACLLGACCLSAGAQTPVAAEPAAGVKNMLLLGDSITTGYGLEAYVPEAPYDCASYGNRLAAKLGLTAGETYFNCAVNGDRSEDLLKLLPELKDRCAAADLIIISIGGNDMLRRLPDVASLLTGLPITDLAAAAAVLTSADPAQYGAAMANPAFTQLFTDILTKYSANLMQILGLLKQYAPTARIIFLKQYNPSAGVAGMEGFNALASALIPQLNRLMEMSVTASGFELADVPSVIDSAAAARTNMLSMDIHPNLAGHGEIYRLLLGMVAPGLTDCAHVWGDWQEISEGLATEPYTAERVCQKCGEKQTREFPAREKATEPAAEHTDVPETEPVTPEKKGCASFVRWTLVISVFCGAAVCRQKRNY